jgi:hypothetical protein
MFNFSIYPRFVAVALLLSCLSPVAWAGHVSLEPEKVVSVKSAEEKPISSFAVQFDLSRIGRDQRIDGAVLKLTFSADTLLGPGVEILVRVASESWQESLLARQTAVGTVDTLMSSSYSSSGDGKEAEFDVLEIVQMWYSGEVANNGFVISAHRNLDRKFELANKPGEWGATLEVFFSGAQ